MQNLCLNSTIFYVVKVSGFMCLILNIQTHATANMCCNLYVAYNNTQIDVKSVRMGFQR